MTTKFTTTCTTTHVLVECCHCTALTGLPRRLYERCYDNEDGSFYCCQCGTKQGWGEGFGGSSKLQKERRRREQADARARAALDQAEAAERSRRAVKGHLTRTKKRIAGGVCPCCNRSFQNLARHMAGQHPDYVEVAP